MRATEFIHENKITLSTDPNWYGAEVGDYKASGPVVNIPANQLVGFEPDDKMNQPASKANVAKIVAGIKQGAKLPPLLVRRYKNGYQVLDGHHRFWAYKLSGVKDIPAQVVPDSDIEEKGQQGVSEGRVNDTAITLSRLGKFHPGVDTLAEFVPERAAVQYALHPDKWESTFYSLTNKDSDKLKYYGPKEISIPPGTLVGDMAIANKFYRAKTQEEKQQHAEAYKASLQPYPVDVTRYRMPELLIPRQGVSEGSQEINWVKPNFDFEWHEVEEQSRMKQVPVDVRRYYQKHFPNKDAWLKAVQNGKAVVVPPNHSYEIRNAPFDKESLQKVLAPTGHEGPIGPAKEKRVNALFDKGQVEMPIILKTSQGLWLIGGKTRLGTANYIKGIPAKVWMIGGEGMS